MSKKNMQNTYMSVLNEYNLDPKETHNLKLKKAHIPLQICFKLAFKNIWKKKFRYLVMMIVCAISLAFLSFTIELNGDPLRQNVFTMVENGYTYTEIKQFVPLDNQTTTDVYAKYNYGDLPDNSYNIIKTEIPELTVHKYEEVEIKYAGLASENKNFFYTGTIDTIICYDQTNSYNLICGRVPTLHTQEIIVTDYLISALKYFNLVPEYATYEEYLNTYMDLNWYTGYKIVGIIDTNYEKWTKFSRLQTIDETNKDNYSYINDFKMMNAVVLNTEYFELEQNAVGDYTTISDATINIDFTRLTTGNQLNKKPETMNIVGTTVGSTISLEYAWGNNVPEPHFPTKADEIVIPMDLVEEFFNFSYNWYSSSRRAFREYWTYDLAGKNISLSFTSSDGLRTYTKEFTIVGVTNATTSFILFDDEVSQIKNYFFSNRENIMVELPSNPNEALNLFNKALKSRNEEKGIPGYVINVWVYRSDIDSYEVDPFINLISKGGLFVFSIFTIGIMWTIISIEIVDSKKEIGILRSIGLSGGKVSLIFVMQTIFTNLIAYGIAVAAASRFIPLYNSTITDSLGKITLYMYTLTYRTPVFLLIFVVAITLISTLIPLIKIMSQKIIDVINEREK